MKKLYLTILFLISLLAVRSQTDSSTWRVKPKISFSGFVDLFYAYDFNEPKTNYRQAFLYNHNRHNEINVNLGLLKLSVKHLKYRANIALHAGTYVTDNYAAEPVILKNIYEGNAGLSLNKKNNLWVDAGVFSSHIGFESAISKDNWTLTRSLLAENSPYYLSGVKLTYNPNESLELGTIICNGWQRIKRVSGNSLPAFGTQIKYSKAEKIILNWSTFIGTDSPDSIRKMRYFNNFYIQVQPVNRLGLIAGFDIGAQQVKKSSSMYNTWFSPIVIVRYALSEKWFTSLRAEYYEDKYGVLINTLSPNGFKTKGLSVNFDYLPIKNIVCRLEARWLNSFDRIFQKNNNFTNDNYCVVTSIAASF
jgi:hypothetical protein